MSSDIRSQSPDLFHRVDLFLRMVAGTHQRAGLNMAQPLGLADSLPVGKLLRPDPALDLQVPWRGLQVLPYGEDVAADGDEVVDERFKFVGFLTQAEHDACLGRKTLIFRDLQELKRSRVL